MSPPLDKDQDAAFRAFPHTTRQRIDSAFDSVFHSIRSPPTKRRKLNSSETSPQPGGFLLDDSLPGGFVREASHVPDGGSSTPTPDHNHISLSLIPSALQVLDLPPDDEDILSVFRNAASGWSHQSRLDHSSPSDPEDALVSRADWRAVCAALLDVNLSDQEHGDEPMSASSDHGHDDIHQFEDDSNEEYIDSQGSELDGDDDEYHVQGPSSSRRAKSNLSTRKSRTRRASTSFSDTSDVSASPRRLSARQKQECRAAFALFFPQVPDRDLDRQRIAMKDISRVATLLKEKISAEETVDMLEAFSTAPDKTMGLTDFQTMMITAKLV